MLSKCFTERGTLVCPETITRRSDDGSWLGIPWSPSASLPFIRTHVPVKCETRTDSIIHLGGRYFLSTKLQSITIAKKPMKLSPLAVYHLPCNMTSDDLLTGFGHCPSTITIAYPIFRRNRFKYIPWTPSQNNATLDLHFKSLNIPPPLHFNQSIRHALDETYKRLDGDLALKIQKVNKDIQKLHETDSSTSTKIIASIALAIAILNIVILITLCCLHRQRNNQDQPFVVHSVQTTGTPRPHSPHFKEEPQLELQPLNDTCPDCHGSIELTPEPTN